jgi:two-component system sensor histidine kinase MtrB
MRRVGLRARVTAGFAAGALALSASMALVSYQVLRGSLLDERERTAVRTAYYDAAVVNAGLGGDTPDIVEALRSLDTGGDRRAVLLRGGVWYARTVDTGVTTAVPAELRAMVEQGRPAVQRVRSGDRPYLVVGVPLSATTSYYEVDSLAELDRTFGVLALVLTAVAIATAAGGAALGWYGTRYVLRPLASVADAAEEITAGALDARLDPATEPELARLSTSFNLMVDQLSRRLQRDRRFAADVSHELRSPLQTLSAAASVLTRRRNSLDERSATAAGLVADEVARFQSLVEDLLELARSDQPARREPVDVADLARQALLGRELSPGMVEVEVGADTVWSVDRRRVEQLLGNLLDNAVRHGGGPSAVRLSASGERWCIEVDDEGPGVSPEYRETIFDRFVRGRAAGARGGGDGTGLGLALVAQHAAAHHGTAMVTDRPGGGARFRVELPREQP